MQVYAINVVIKDLVELVLFAGEIHLLVGLIVEWVLLKTQLLVETLS